MVRLTILSTIYHGTVYNITRFSKYMYVTKTGCHLYSKADVIGMGWVVYLIRRTSRSPVMANVGSFTSTTTKIVE